MAKFLDANIILRYLLGDPEADKIEKVFKKQEEIYVADIVIAEVIWTFTSFYKWKKGKIIPRIRTFLSPGFVKADKVLLNKALDYYEEYNVDYVDAYLVALMKDRKERSIYSFDKHFDKIPQTHRIEPK